MKKLRQIFVMVLAVLLLAISFAACNQKAGDKNEGAKATETATPTATPTPTLETTPEATPDASPDAAENVEADKMMGVVSGTTYTNDYFNFTAEFPKDWTIASKEEILMINQLGADLFKENGGNQNLIDIAKQRVVPLFFVSQHPLDYTEGTNANINAVSENISIAAGVVKSGKDYLTLATQAIKAQGIDYTLDEITELKLGGKDFAKADAVLKMSGVEVTQTMYAGIIGDHAVIFTLSYFSDDDKKALESVIKTISFK